MSFYKINDARVEYQLPDVEIGERQFLDIDYHRTYDLTEFICESQGQPCNSLSKKLAESLIRVAATRIFADPSQSIIELPVNSIDGYRREKFRRNFERRIDDRRMRSIQGEERSDRRSRSEQGDESRSRSDSDAGRSRSGRGREQRIEDRMSWSRRNEPELLTQRQQEEQDIRENDIIFQRNARGVKSEFTSTTRREWKKPSRSMFTGFMAGRQQIDQNISIGKFGLGFFSFLYWLYEYPTGAILIESQTLGFNAWKLVVRNQEDKLYAYFEYGTNMGKRFQEGRGFYVTMVRKYKDERFLPPLEPINEDNAERYLNFAVHRNDRTMFDSAASYITDEDVYYDLCEIAVSNHYFSLALHIAEMSDLSKITLIIFAITANALDFMVQILRSLSPEELEKVAEIEPEHLIYDIPCLEYLLSNNYVKVSPRLVDAAIYQRDFTMIRVINEYLTPRTKIDMGIYLDITEPDLYVIHRITTGTARRLLSESVLRLLKKIKEYNFQQGRPYSDDGAFYESIIRPFFAFGDVSPMYFLREVENKEMFQFYLGKVAGDYPEILGKLDSRIVHTRYFNLGLTVKNRVAFNPDDFKTYDISIVQDFVTLTDSVEYLRLFNLEFQVITKNMGRHGSINLIKEMLKDKRYKVSGLTLCAAVEAEQVETVKFLLGLPASRRSSHSGGWYFQGLISSCWCRDNSMAKMFIPYIQEMSLEDRNYGFTHHSVLSNPDPHIVEFIYKKSAVGRAEIKRIFGNYPDVLAHMHERHGLDFIENFNYANIETWINPGLAYILDNHAKIRDEFYRYFMRGFSRTKVNVIEHMIRHNILDVNDINRYTRYVQDRNFDEDHINLIIKYKLDLAVSSENVFDLRRQISRLRYINDVEILLTTDTISVARVYPGQVLVNLTLDEFSCLDAGPGVSLEVLFNQLLVPSSSTKTIQASQQASQLSPSGSVSSGSIFGVRIEYYPGGIVITVGGVVVVEVGKSDLTYLIELPITTPLPVSRDDILFNREIIEIIYLAFVSLANRCIITGCNLEDYFSCLRAYVDYSVSTKLVDIVERVEKEVTSRDDIVFVPDGDVAKLLHRQLSAKATFAHYSTASLVETKMKLDNIFGTEGTGIYQGQRLIPLSGLTVPTDGGIPGYIFYPAETPEIVNNLIDSYNKVILTPVSSSSLTVDQPFPSGQSADISSKYRPWTFLMSEVAQNYRMSVRIHPFGTMFYTPDWDELMFKHEDELDILYDTIYAKMLNYSGYKNVYNGSSILREMPSPRTNPILSYDSDQNANAAQLIVLWTIYVIMNNIYPYADEDKIGNLIAEYIAQMTSLIANLKFYTTLGVKTVFQILSVAWSSQSFVPDYVTIISNNQTNFLFDTPLNQSLSQNTRDKIIRGQFEAIRANIDTQGYYNQIFISTDFLVNPQHLYSPFLVRSGIEAFDQLVSRSRNAVEASCLIMIFHASGIDPELPIINFITTESRRRFTTSYFIDLLYKRQMLIDEFVHRFHKEYIVPLVDIALIFVEQSSSFPEIPEFSLRPYTNFTAKQLVSYILDKGQTPFAITAGGAKRYPPVQNLQIIEIAVNEGTSKDFIPSVLTELVQNSLDAVRSSPFKESTISITQYSNGISVRDRIGISSQNLIYLLVPFLSSKSAKDMMTTGEMGTGFFNVYRQPWVEKVVIYTDATIITAIPIIVSGRVVDIEYQISKAPKVEGTTVFLKFRQLPREEMLDLILETSIFTRTYLANVDGKIEFNESSVNIVKDLVYNSSDVSVYITSENVESMVLTNGIPLAPLKTYLTGVFGTILNDDISVGIVMDLSKGSYVPSQSRHRLRIPDQTKAAIRIGLMNGLNELMLRGRVKINKYLPDYNSKVSLDQFVGYAGNPRAYITGPQDPFGLYMKTPVDFSQETMSSYINMGIQRSKDSEAASRSSATSRSTGSRWTDITGKISIITPTVKLIVGWFKNKSAYRDIKVDVVSVVDSRAASSSAPSSAMAARSAGAVTEVLEVVDSPEAKELLMYVSYFVQIYFWVGITLDFTKGVKFRTIPAVEFGRIDGALAVYRRKDEDIVINLVSPAVVTDLVDQFRILIGKFKEGNKTEANVYLLSNEIGNWIGNKTPSALIIHEIQHALYGNDHQSESHGIREIEYAGKTYNLSFDEGCAFVYAQVCAAGFWEKFAENFK